VLGGVLARGGGDYPFPLPHLAPPNDGGIAYGQAAAALAQMKNGRGVS